MGKKKEYALDGLFWYIYRNTNNALRLKQMHATNIYMSFLQSVSIKELKTRYLTI